MSSDEAVDGAVGETAELRPRSRAGPVLFAGLLLGGAVAWTFGVVAGLGNGGVVSDRVLVPVLLLAMLALAILSVRAGFRASGPAALAGRIVQLFGIGLTAAIFLGGLFAVSMVLGDRSEPRAFFWMWLFGTGMTFAALRLLRSETGAPAPRSAPLPVPARVALWAAAWLTSLTVAFPPLRDAVLERRSPDETTPSFAEPSDDDD
jgi:hypothetical protein